MPLDVQPLSKTRRWTAAAVLVGLFAASMGFADYLVARRGPTLRVTLQLPASFDRPVHDFDRVSGVITQRASGEGATERRIGVFQLDLGPPPVGDPDPAVTDAIALYEAAFGTRPEKKTVGVLAGRPAVEVWAIDDKGAFGFVRLARIGQEAVAICYSGPAFKPDLDMRIFDDICTRDIHVQVLAHR